MVPAITDGGRSFKGAALYYLHDKRQPGEAARLTTGRIAWTEVLNLPTDDPDMAWRMMADTATCQAALKKAAGVKATGRKLESPVLAYSLSWHPDERPSAADQLAAARETLKELGLADHQAVIAAHNDEPHPHVHVMVNRVHPATGIAAKLSKSHLVLSKWAQGYEQRQGKIYCHERVENNARREGLRPGRASDNRVRRLSRAELAAGAPSRKTAATLERIALGFGEQLATERHGERSRKAEKEKLHRDRREARQATRDRHQAASENEKKPTTAKQAARLADLLLKATPALSLAELTRTRSTFTRQELVRMVGRHTQDDAVFKAVLDKLETAPELVRVGKDERGRERFTTKSQQDIERAMERHARLLHAIKSPAGDVRAKWAGQSLSAEQDRALRHVLAAPGLSAIIGYAGSGKSTLLNAARQSWEAAGYKVRGATLSGIAADSLSAGAGIESRTIHSRLFQWDKGQGKLTDKDVLVIDEAGMIGSRQMERLLAHALEVKAKVVLVGDAEQLQAIEAGAAFRAIVERVGSAELRTVRRQKQDWQKEATFDLATGKTGEALRRYEVAGMVQAHDTDDQAKAAVIDAWAKHRQDRPAESQIILAYTNLDVRGLNELARARLKEAKILGPGQVIQTESGKREFAAGDRLYFLKNDTAMGVRNGTLGTVERIVGDRLTVRLDGPGGRLVTFSASDYGKFDHGYAATIHKSQGVTVDRAHLLASRNLDRHSAYVAMTRHRDRLDVHWSSDRFKDRAELSRILSRKTSKDTSLDYGDDIDNDRQAKREAAAEMRERVDRRARAFADREKTPAGRMRNARSLAGSDAPMMEVARLALNSRARTVKFKQQQAKLTKWAKRTETGPEIAPAASAADHLAAARQAREEKARAAPRRPAKQQGRAANDQDQARPAEATTERQDNNTKPPAVDLQAQAYLEWVELNAGVDLANDSRPDGQARRQPIIVALAAHDAETGRQAKTMTERHKQQQGQEEEERDELQERAYLEWAELAAEMDLANDMRQEDGLWQDHGLALQLERNPNDKPEPSPPWTKPPRSSGPGF